MVLDLNLFRKEKGGDPEALKEGQRKRFKDVTLVDKVIDADAEWRQVQFRSDKWNNIKNIVSKAIGKKMKAKEPQGDSDELSDEVKANMLDLTVESLDKFTVRQLKALSAEVDSRKKADALKTIELEEQRLHNLRQIGNTLHSTCVISDNEDNNKIERTFGDIEVKTIL